VADEQVYYEAAQLMQKMKYKVVKKIEINATNKSINFQEQKTKKKHLYKEAIKLFKYKEYNLIYMFRLKPSARDRLNRCNFT